MKTVDKVRLAIMELGSEWTRKDLRSKFSKEEISDAVLDNTIGKIRKEGKDLIISGIYGNIPEMIRYSLSPQNIISKEVRDLCLSLYGNTWGRLMAYILSCYDEEIVVDQTILGSCHDYGYSALLLGKTPNYKDLAADIYDRHIEECPFALSISDFIPEKKVRTVENFECVEEILTALENPCTELVEVFTGHPIESRTIQESSTNSEIENLRNRLVNQNLDYSAILDDNFKNAFAIVSRMENVSERIKQFSLLNRIRISPSPLYSAVSKSMRLYAKGASFQCLSRDVRKVFFSGMRQFDLKHAQLNIISKLWDAPELITYFSGKSIWATLVSETNLSKDAIKKGVYTLIFGGSYENAILNMAESAELPSWRVKQNISTCKFFKLLEIASKRYSSKIKLDMSCKDAFGNELVTSSKLSAKDIRSIKGCQAQSYEIAIMLPILNHLLDKGFPCSLFLHDGFISSTESYMIYPELKALTEYVSKQFGMSLSLEMETLEV